MILAICVVVDESKFIDIPIWEFSIICEHLPFWGPKGGGPKGGGPKGGGPKGGGPKGGGPKGGGPKGGGPKGGGPKGGGLKGWEAQNFALFFHFPAGKFALFFPLWVSSRGILVVFEASGRSNVHVRAPAARWQSQQTQPQQRQTQNKWGPEGQ